MVILILLLLCACPPKCVGYGGELDLRTKTLFGVYLGTDISWVAWVNFAVISLVLCLGQLTLTCILGDYSLLWGKSVKAWACRIDNN